MDKFKDLPTQRFYEFFQAKIKNKEITYTEFAGIFGKSKTNPHQFMQDLKTAKKGITVKHILIAQEEYGLQPQKLFK